MGLLDGCKVGLDGDTDGILLGGSEGASLGSCVGVSLGVFVGLAVGLVLGLVLGLILGLHVGEIDGESGELLVVSVGLLVGYNVVGYKVGLLVSTSF